MLAVIRYLLSSGNKNLGETVDAASSVPLTLTLDPFGALGSDDPEAELPRSGMVSLSDGHLRNKRTKVLKCAKPQHSVLREGTAPCRPLRIIHHCLLRSSNLSSADAL